MVVVAILLVFINPVGAFLAKSATAVRPLESERGKFIDQKCTFGVCHASIIDVNENEVINGKELIDKLRLSKVTSINNEVISLGDVMGTEKAVVVFLRHLG
jgi:hypothetical protein